VPLSGATVTAPPRDRASEARDLMELVDWCRYVAGAEPTSVVSVRHAEVPGGATDDYQMMSLDFTPTDEGTLAPGNGTLAQISCGYYMPRQWEEAVGFRPPAALQVACEKGIAFIDLPSSLVWFDGVGRHQETLESERPVGEQMLLQFHNAALGACVDFFTLFMPGFVQLDEQIFEANATVFIFWWIVGTAKEGL
jgi:hypothetical protein